MILRPCARFISTSTPSSSRYDAKVFREPITDREELKKPLAADDERNFLFIKALKSDETPTFYRNHVVDKLVRVCMTDGRKETSRKNVLSALEIIKRKQYQTWLNALEDQKSKIELSAFKIVEEGINNCKPLMKLQGVIRGGTKYDVPFPIEDDEAEFRAMKMMRDICRQKAKHGETFFKDALAAELMLASQNEGATIQAKQELHKTCEANRAYAHYRG
ncbi:hypothetical protein PFISCL1PPCAC_15337 [Pristionchus fissidentatus]|uniref:Small ribosomal subunit protein uS7m n=1 Tax=Pristionchus fissidentatus TaxID=1538716 RepID=A0AAV5VZY4_9BILA|nr:hypothetical protein PFISCL1PPCAC_15337 [Pristionchus fissidentatus]